MKDRIVAFIDYDNMDSVMRDYDKTKLDFTALMEEFLKIGRIDFAFLFIPYATYHSLPQVNNLGFEIIVCQKIMAGDQPDKREDKVDSRMAMVGKSFLGYEEISDVVILTHDKHSVEFASEVIKAGKRLTYFAIKDKMGKELQDFTDAYNIPVISPPSKPRPSLESLIHP